MREAVQPRERQAEVELVVLEREALDVRGARLDLIEVALARDLACPGEHGWSDVGGDVASAAAGGEAAQRDAAAAWDVEDRAALGNLSDGVERLVEAARVGPEQGPPKRACQELTLDEEAVDGRPRMVASPVAGHVRHRRNLYPPHAAPGQHRRAAGASRAVIDGRRRRPRTA